MHETREGPQVAVDLRLATPTAGRDDDRQLLRFLTCGSVDDGKSTLIGRLLYDTSHIPDDQLAALRTESARRSVAGGELDFSLLVDGLEAEREQGITIDVAYRFFATRRRTFIIADAPGHEQYTRNMATGASTAELAIVLVDGRSGALQQTRRHCLIASLLGVRNIVLAVNKMDLVDFAQQAFTEMVDRFVEFAAPLGFVSLVAIPLSARFGDNITRRSARMLWYNGPTLLEHLEQVPIDDGAAGRPFRLPIQYVNRANDGFRGYCGTIASGTAGPGDPLVVAKSGRASRVKRIVTRDGDLSCAGAGKSVTLLLEDDVELSRGDMLVPPAQRPHIADQFAATVLWFDEHPLVPGRSFLLRTETDQVAASVSALKYRIDVDSFAHEAAESLALNEIGHCNLTTQAPIAFDSYADNRTTGAFVLIDRMTHATAGAGMILHPLFRAANLRWQALDIDKAARAALMRQRPAVLWFTGRPGSGKSTIANLLEKRLHLLGLFTYVLDGDNVRHGLSRDLGFTEADRVENIRRVAEVARLMADAGLIVLVAFISPFRAERQMARELMSEGEFFEIFVDTPFEECVRRDPKGHYARALRGEIRNFTGVDSPYEPPENEDIRLATVGLTPEETVHALFSMLRERGVISLSGDDR